MVAICITNTKMDLFSRKEIFKNMEIEIGEGSYMLVKIRVGGRDEEKSILYRIEGIVNCVDCKEEDGLVCRMVDGNSSLYREGKTVVECAKVIERNIGEGITRIMTKQEGDKIMNLKSGVGNNRRFTGVIEL